MLHEEIGDREALQERSGWRGIWGGAVGCPTPSGSASHPLRPIRFAPRVFDFASGALRGLPQMTVMGPANVPQVPRQDLLLYELNLRDDSVLVIWEDGQSRARFCGPAPSCLNSRIARCTMSLDKLWR